MTRIGVQLWSLREHAELDFAAVLDRVAAIGYDGVETAGLHRLQPADFRARLDDLGLELIGHFSVLPPLRDMEAALREPESIGAEVVVAGLDEADCRTPDAVERGVERLNRFARLARGRGMALVYHNHWWEFEAHDAWRPFDLILDGLDPEILIEADVYWLQGAGVDAAAELERLGSRVKRVHVKDGPLPARHAQAAVGAGALDIPAILAAAPHVDWQVVELDDHDGEMFDAVEASFRFLDAARVLRAQ
jgi:sugar phosphate isomerase/epimerase